MARKARSTASTTSTGRPGSTTGAPNSLCWFALCPTSFALRTEALHERGDRSPGAAVRLFRPSARTSRSPTPTPPYQPEAGRACITEAPLRRPRADQWTPHAQEPDWTSIFGLTGYERRCVSYTYATSAATRAPHRRSRPRPDPAWRSPTGGGRQARRARRGMCRFTSSCAGLLMPDRSRILERLVCARLQARPVAAAPVARSHAHAALPVLLDAFSGGRS